MRKMFTIILLIQTLEDQPQFLFMILEIMNKFLKIQLPIQVLVSSLHNFLFRKQSKPVSSFVHADRSAPSSTIRKDNSYRSLIFPPESSQQNYANSSKKFEQSSSVEKSPDTRQLSQS